jgi:hypothetical protein
VKVVVNNGAGLTRSVIPATDGAWSVTTSVLPVGTYNFTATATNSFGDVSAASAPFQVIIAPPPPPVITGFSPDTGTLGDHITEAHALTISGTGEPGTTKVVVTNGAGFTRTVLPDAGGAWSVTTGTLPLFTYNFTATATDSFGDVSVASKPFQIIVAPPPPPLITGFSPDTGTIGDHTTEAHVITLTGSAEHGTMKVVVTNGVGLTRSVIPDTTGAWSIATSSLPFGTYNFTATATDTFGDVSVASKVFQVIVAPPPPPVITGFTPDTGTVGDHATDAHVLTLTGTAEPGTVKVVVTNGVGFTRTATPDGTGAWSVTTNTLPLGTYNFTATATDPFGDVSVASKVFQVIVAPPPPPVITGFSPDAGVAGENVTNAHTVTITGTAEPGLKQVTVRDGAGAVRGVVPDANGNWSISFSALPVGVYAFTATAADSSGDVSVPSDPFSVEVNGAPTIIKPGSQLIEEGKVTGVSGISIADADADSAGETITVHLTDSVGLLAATTKVTGGGGTITGSRSRRLTITGTQGQVNADLSTLTDLLNTFVVDPITIVSNDGRGGTDHKSLTVSDDVPASTATPAQLLVQQGAVTSVAGISIADPDARIANETIKVTRHDRNAVCNSKRRRPAVRFPTSPRPSGHAGPGECGPRDAHLCQRCLRGRHHRGDHHRRHCRGRHPSDRRHRQCAGGNDVADAAADPGVRERRADRGHQSCRCGCRQRKRAHNRDAQGDARAQHHSVLG